MRGKRKIKPQKIAEENSSVSLYQSTIITEKGKLNLVVRLTGIPAQFQQAVAVSVLNYLVH